MLQHYLQKQFFAHHRNWNIPQAASAVSATAPCKKPRREDLLSALSLSVLSIGATPTGFFPACGEVEKA